MTEKPREPITEDWLSSVGFKWTQLDRQPSKHWTLWLGWGIVDNDRYDSDDIGIELASSAMDGKWYCWFRGDLGGRYSRFIHVRHFRYQDDIIRLIEAITGAGWKPENHRLGAVYRQDRADRMRAEDDRIDKRWAREAPPWNAIEKDETRGRARSEHVQELEDLKKRGGNSDRA